MTAQRIILVSLLAIIVLTMYRFISQDRSTLLSPSPTPSNTQQAPCTPTFADGGGPYYKPNSPFRSKLVPETNTGEQLIVTGKVLQGDCSKPVANAVLDIWQANETGNYQDEWYRGQIRTDDQGNYSFESIVPKGYGEGTGYRPPHIHFKVFVEGREIITSQMFFPEAKGKPGFDDAYIMKLETSSEGAKPVHTGTHDIILPLQ